MTDNFDKGGEGLAAYEPDPIPNDGPSMHDLVINDLWDSEDGEDAWSEPDRFGVSEKTNELFDDIDLVTAAIDDLTDRKKFGLDKYNTVLQAFNGRNALVDAYQEIQDLLVYLRQAMCENRVLNRELWDLYTNTLKSFLLLKRELIKLDG